MAVDTEGHQTLTEGREAGVDRFQGTSPAIPRNPTAETAAIWLTSRRRDNKWP